MTGYIITTGGDHLGDGTLIGLLDGEASSDARSHLAHCAECSERFTSLQRAAGLLRASLPDVAMPAMHLPRTTRRRQWLIPIPIAAAATLVILASAAAATPPVREWIRNRLVGSTPHATPVSESALASPAAKAAGIVASFVANDTALVIRVDRRQASGAIELDRAPGDRISAQAVGGTAAEELLVLPGQLRISNTSISSADYRITIPGSVRTVRVLVEGHEVAVIRGEVTKRRIDLR